MHVEDPPFLTPANVPPTTESNDAPPKKKKAMGENFYLKVRHLNHFDITCMSLLERTYLETKTIHNIKDIFLCMSATLHQSIDSLKLSLLHSIFLSFR